jgi:serine/threonine protein kinase
MASPPTRSRDEFLDLVRKSGAADAERLDAALRAAPPGGDAPHLAAALVKAGVLTPFQAKLLLRGQWKGFLISGKYRLLDLLGAGGMGKVYLCEHVRMRRLVALKALPLNKDTAPGMLERFDREARAVAALKHPNIVQAYDIDQDGRLHFLVMEYVDGKSLQEIVRTVGPLDPVRAAHYVAQSAIGLQHAHEEAGLVHRDVKPGNLLLERSGTVKVLDLGLAKFFNDKTDEITKNFDEKSVLGTADYLSPEQALNSADVDIRADVYSLGATFYFLLTGRPPFGEGTVTQKLLWHQMREPLPVRALRPEVDEELEAVIARMMAKDPAQRYQVPADVADALARWTQEPIAPPSDAEMPPRQVGSGPATSSRLSASRPAVSVTPSAARLPPVTPPPAETPPVSREATAIAPARRTVPWASIAAGLGAAALVAVAAVAYSLNAPGPPPRPREGPAPATGEVVVDKSGRPGTFASLREALRQAKPGSTVVLAENLAETVLLTRNDVPEGGVTVEGRPAAGKAIVWRPGPKHQAGQAVLELNNVTGLKLRNVVFEGQNKAEDLLRITGSCEDVTLESLVLRFSRVGCRFSGTGGSAARPLRFQAVHCVATQEFGSCLLFDAPAGRDNRHVHVRHSRFEGPAKAALFCAGPTVELVFEGNRVWSMETGIHYEKAVTPFPFSGVFTSNTFFETTAAFDFAAAPPHQQQGQSSVRNNLFVQVPTVVQLDGRPAPPRLNFLASPVWNGVDRSALPGSEVLGCQMVPVADLERNSQRGEAYLRYSKFSPLATITPDNQPVGAPPLGA